MLSIDSELWHKISRQRHLQVQNQPAQSTHMRSAIQIESDQIRLNRKSKNVQQFEELCYSRCLTLSTVESHSWCHIINSLYSFNHETFLGSWQQWLQWGAPEIHFKSHFFWKISDFKVANGIKMLNCELVQFVPCRTEYLCHTRVPSWLKWLKKLGWWRGIHNRHLCDIVMNI